jgi:hypothetical protein
MMKCISILEVNYVQPKKVIYRRHTSISQILELFKSKGVNRSRNGQRREAQSVCLCVLGVQWSTRYVLIMHSHT